tara:strand:- start:293 stop:1036 length:744 start_codon:yes stop_codon:yes gene_type:complete
MKTKKCTKCGIEKELDCFYKDSKKKDGLRYRCKSCFKTNSAEYYQNNKEKNKKQWAEYYQNNKEKILKQKAEYRKNNKEKIAKKSAEYRKNNKERIAEYIAEYRKNNKEKIAKQRAEYRKNNKERIAEHMAEYHKKRKLEQPACVYQIMNTVNNKIYIGQSTLGEIRWYRHLTNLRGNRHPNHKIQADFNKFGEDAFEWSIIKEYPKDKDTLLLEEAKTIVKYRKEGKDLYNLTLTIDQVQLLEENK